MEHEAEKYQERLKAIAEKRRIQEEEEQARREIENERLRFQQLKRKSLRDQWLMEGPPTSPDSTGPRSPLWGAKAQEIETHINKSQASEQLADKELKLKQLIEDGSSQTGTDAQTQHKEEAVMEPAGAAVAETDPNGPILENGKEEKKDDSVQNENHDEEEAGPVNGAKTETDTTPPLNGNVEGDQSHSGPEEDEHASANDFNSHPAGELSAGGVTMTFLGFKEAEPGQGVDEDDDGGAIIRAERVILTDEGEEIPEEVKAAQEPTVDTTNEDTSGNTEENGAEEKTAKHPEATADPEQAEVIEDPPAEEILPDVAGEGETQDLQDLKQEVKDLPESTETQPQNVTVDGTIEAAQVPVYSTTQPSPAIRPKVEANSTESQTPKDEEVTLATRNSLSQFQEVPLDGAGETGESNAKAETEKQRAEQEPLLVSKAAAQLDTSPNRAEDAGAPKQKTCQCCSVM
ncbi:paralemmin-3 isoform X1 [Carassius auratus]|uniref:Paralemmin-3-like isoform X1 n=2 Tax=Carassius auratus TaxID=7957 RepID=A0A6P6NX64_CARAU|nr:paralemmin-3-like isoform X1 [Carassius auratus]XP_026113246.1 paralemmin-3-like isoform X1 [Carassius auratus]XP_026113253.1 paralemmin-3-like isoform X1 [Carassius auratus]